MPRMITFTVNGVLWTVLVEPGDTLLEVLREKLGLTGAKPGCGTGDCGACTVLFDGRPAPSCLVLAPDAHGREIWTVEGLGEDRDFRRLQAAFVEHGAVQCGFCTPGMLIAAYALLRANPAPTEEEAREAISGNLCRCTGYQKIVAAILAAAAGQTAPEQSAPAFARVAGFPAADPAAGPQKGGEPAR